MLKTFDRNTRRILNFPAVLPSQDVNPATLLRSLVSLSHSITLYQSESFATNRRNARESIRQITILSMFFNEILALDVAGLPDSAMLCFSELHYSFQKIQFLLEDCTRSGARVWILMKSYYIAMQFQSLTRAIATALEVIPLNSIELSRDVNELVDLVAKQAKKATMEVDPDDDYEMKRVMLILNQFENQFEPDPIMIRRALRHLRIDSWSECHEEIRFLNQQISLELLETNERDLHLLRSLVGFMRYCRGTLFENFVFENTDNRLVGKANLDTLSCLNPVDFRCPISLELMTDPVIVSTGTIPPLMTLLSSSDPTTQENAIAGLLKLSKHSNGKKAMIVHGGLSSIIHVLKNGVKEECKQIASATIFYLSSNQTTQTLLGEIPEAIPGLIEQIKTGSSCGKRNSLAALFVILLNPGNHKTAISFGIVKLLTDLISTSQKPEIVTDSLAVVSALAESFDGSNRILKDSSLPLITKTLQTSTSRASKEYCVSILLALYNNLGNQVVAFLASYPDLIGFLYKLSTTGGSQASKKARSLIRIVQMFHKTSGSGLMAGWDSSRITTVRSC
ncbi:hypothetical protein L1987_08319 [Smallanthus sonchifolius]|uniref:Uncharacterized protein n=1 Tax=Smallanthus sonchifolius TaxID=185202 RepID=A0ACB9JM36_9ASTR|nr:hypothetical protein L1987_08319 [Smallanthus sonchifolius]